MLVSEGTDFKVTIDPPRIGADWQWTVWTTYGTEGGYAVVYWLAKRRSKKALKRLLKLRPR